MAPTLEGTRFSTVTDSPDVDLGALHARRPSTSATPASTSTAPAAPATPKSCTAPTSRPTHVVELLTKLQRGSS